MPDGTRIFLTVQRWTGSGWSGVYPGGSYELDVYIVSANGNVFGTNFGPNANYTVFPVSSLPPAQVRYGSGGPTTPTWASIIPNGVSRVRWIFKCSGTRCAERRVTVAVRILGNVAAADLPGSKPELGPSGPHHFPRRLWLPVKITWYGRGGRVVARFRLSATNLSVPPFIKTR